MLSDSYVKVIDVLGLFFDMLSMGFYTTRHWQTSGRLVQELDVCTVANYCVVPHNQPHPLTAWFIPVIREDAKFPQASERVRVKVT